MTRAPLADHERLPRLRPSSVAMLYRVAQAVDDGLFGWLT